MHFSFIRIFRTIAEYYKNNLFDYGMAKVEVVFNKVSDKGKRLVPKTPLLYFVYCIRRRKTVSKYLFFLQNKY